MENGVRHYACKRDEGRSKIRKKSKVGESRGFFLFFFFFFARSIDKWPHTPEITASEGFILWIFFFFWLQRGEGEKKNLG